MRDCTADFTEYGLAVERGLIPRVCQRSVCKKCGRSFCADNGTECYICRPISQLRAAIRKELGLEISDEIAAQGIELYDVHNINRFQTWLLTVIYPMAEGQVMSA